MLWILAWERVRPRFCQCLLCEYIMRCDGRNGFTMLHTSKVWSHDTVASVSLVHMLHFLADPLQLSSKAELPQNLALPLSVWLSVFATATGHSLSPRQNIVIINCWWHKHRQATFSFYWQTRFGAESCRRSWIAANQNTKQDSRD